MLVYISHPYGGKEENKTKIEIIVQDLALKYPEITFVSPVHTFGFMYDTVAYEHGMTMCLELLSKCDQMMVFGDYTTSRGCVSELLFAQEFHMPYSIHPNRR